MTSKVTCTAVLANYNHAMYLDKALDAALGQSVPFDEIIVVDDASTDHSAEIIARRFAGIPHARLIRNDKNIGVVASLNKAVEAATGDFIYIMSSDDSYSPHIMQWCRPILEANPDIGMICGNNAIYNEETGVERHFSLPFPQKMARYDVNDLEVIAKKHVFTFRGGANVIRREAILKAGNQLPELKWHSDWLLYLIVACRQPFVVIPETFIRIRQTRGQYSHACFIWAQQKPVIESFIHILKEQYPQEYAFFRSNALLPTYDAQALWLLLTDRTLRHFLTPLLAWRLITYKLFRLAGKSLSDESRSQLRRLFRV